MNDLNINRFCQCLINERQCVEVKWLSALTEEKERLGWRPDHRRGGLCPHERGQGRGPHGRHRGVKRGGWGRAGRRLSCGFKAEQDALWESGPSCFLGQCSYCLLSPAAALSLLPKRERSSLFNVHSSNKHTEGDLDISCEDYRRPLQHIFVTVHTQMRTCVFQLLSGDFFFLMQDSEDIDLYQSNVVH